MASRGSPLPTNGTGRTSPPPGIADGPQHGFVPLKGPAAAPPEPSLLGRVVGLLTGRSSASPTEDAAHEGAWAKPPRDDEPPSPTSVADDVLSRRPTREAAPSPPGEALTGPTKPAAEALATAPCAAAPDDLYPERGLTTCSECGCAMHGAIYMLHDRSYCCQRHRLAAYHKHEAASAQRKAPAPSPRAPSRRPYEGLRSAYATWA